MKRAYHSLCKGNQFFFSFILSSIFRAGADHQTLRLVFLPYALAQREAQVVTSVCQSGGHTVGHDFLCFPVPEHLVERGSHDLPECLLLLYLTDGFPVDDGSVGIVDVVFGGVAPHPLPAGSWTGLLRASFAAIQLLNSRPAIRYNRRYIAFSRRGTIYVSTI